MALHAGIFFRPLGFAARAREPIERPWSRAASGNPAGQAARARPHRAWSFARTFRRPVTLFTRSLDRREGVAQLGKAADDASAALADEILDLQIDDGAFVVGRKPDIAAISDNGFPPCNGVPD